MSPRSDFVPGNRIKDFGVEAAAGNIPGTSTINKFGEATDCDNGVATDVWDGADGATSTDIWVAPTAARIHTLVSSSNSDSDSGGSNPQSTGMRTLRVFYLPDWDTAETTEDVTLDGTAGVVMSNAAVIVHRMVGLTFGSGSTNAGIIKATAASDNTVTAAILASEGQTLMAIYGVPSIQKIFVEKMSADVLKVTGNTVEATGTVLVKENADQADAGFITKERFNFSEVAPHDRDYNGVPKRFDGPCIIKIQVVTDTDNVSCTAEFDGYVVDN